MADRASAKAWPDDEPASEDPVLIECKPADMREFRLEIDRSGVAPSPTSKGIPISAAMTCEKFEAMVNQNDHPCCTQGDIECKPSKGRRVLMYGAIGVLRTRDMKSACETTIKQPLSRKRLAPA